MKYKIISTDFDGTLLTSSKEVTPRAREVLLKYREKGYIVIGITARNLSSVKNVCDITMFNYLILNNGAYIYNVEKEEGKYMGQIGMAQAEKIVNYFESRAKAIDICSTKKYYRYKSEITKPRPFSVKINSMEEVEEPICRINVFGEDIDETRSFKKYIDENFDMVDTVVMQDTDDKNSEKWITLNPKNLNKFSTLKKLCKSLDISTEQVIFFGDGLNDIEIIQGVGLGISMKNALPEVKEKAKITIKTNDENGIAEFLEKNISML